MSPRPGSSVPLDHEYAEQIMKKLWEVVRRKSFKDKDLCAAIDILKHHSEHNYIVDVHAQAAEEILTRNGSQMPGAPAGGSPQPEPEAPGGELTQVGDPAAVLRRLSDAGMLRGRHGQKAVNLLEQSSRWSASQRQYAEDLATEIQKSALVFIAVREMAEAGRGRDFAIAMVEAFEEWGKYTERQLEASREMVIRDGSPDPLAALKRTAPPAPKREAPPPPSDDDIPF